MNDKTDKEISPSGTSSKPKARSDSRKGEHSITEVEVLEAMLKKQKKRTSDAEPPTDDRENPGHEH